MLALALGPALAGCGFRPVHGKDSRASAAQLAKIQILPISDREGQRLWNHLRDRLNSRGEPARPIYVLRVQLVQSVQNLAIRKDEIATRANLIASATYNLTEKATGNVVFQGRSRSTNSYNILQSYFATLSAEEDARNRAVESLADKIRNRIGIFFTQSPSER